MCINVVNFVPVINHNYRTMFKKDLFSVEELAYISKSSEERKRIKLRLYLHSPSTSSVDLWHLTAKYEHSDLYQLLSLLRGCREANLFVLYVIYTVCLIDLGGGPDSNYCTGIKNAPLRPSPEPLGAGRLLSSWQTALPAMFYILPKTSFVVLCPKSQTRYECFKMYRDADFVFFLYDLSQAYQ